MAKTDKTKPWRVRVAEHHPIAIHNHTDGICDLPTDPRTVQPWDRIPHCRWNTLGMHVAGSCCQGCNCRSDACRGSLWTAAGNRKERHEAKRAAKRKLVGSEAWDA